LSGFGAWTQYKKRPPGSTCGQRWEDSPCEASSVVNGDGAPPKADTRNKPDFTVPKRIEPSLSQDPPTDWSQIATGAPPARSIRCNLPRAEKAMALLSGDQKGNVAPSVPESSRAAVPSSGRTHKPVFPLADATYAAVLPSGEMARPPPPEGPVGTTNR